MVEDFVKQLDGDISVARSAVKTFSILASKFGIGKSGENLTEHFEKFERFGGYEKIVGVFSGTPSQCEIVERKLIEEFGHLANYGNVAVESMNANTVYVVYGK